MLEEADSIQVTDPDLRARIGQALESLRREANQSLRHVTLHSTGDGHRTVRVGYVAAAPLWKASYRLVLPAKDGDPARLQGWAVLENQSGANWDGIALTLQYGNPVTFRQAIYQSYYVQRPEVPVEILGRILPSVDTRARPAELAMQKAASPPAGAARMLAAPAPPRRVACRSRRSWPRRRTRCRPPKVWRRRSSSLPRRWCSPPATPPACRSSIAASRPSALISPPPTTCIRCRRSASPTTPERRCPPAC